MKIKIWGARGSLPSPLTPQALQSRIFKLAHQVASSGLKTETDIKQFLSKLPPETYGGFGGNTPCIQVVTDDSEIIIDAGSGIRLCGYDLMEGPCAQGKGEVHLFFTHFHWDHLIGLPFFTPIFIPGNQIHVYSVQPELPQVFANIFQKPYFPVPLAQLASTIHYHTLEPRKPFKLGSMSVTPYALDHPDPCWGFRIESKGRVYSHCVDTEAKRVTRPELGPDLPLYQGVDLMVFDAQYTLMEAIEKIDWGHAAASIGIDIAMREKISRVLFMHHDPASTDEKIAAAEREAKNYYQTQVRAAERNGIELHPVDWKFATEGMVVEV